jgi:hypothetical protein
LELSFFALSAKRDANRIRAVRNGTSTGRIEKTNSVARIAPDTFEGESAQSYNERRRLRNYPENYRAKNCR